MSVAFTSIQTHSSAGVLTIVLNRPDALNSLDESMSVELSAALRTAQRDDAVRCVVLTGEGRAFCAGQDLREIQESYPPSHHTADLDFGAHLRKRYNPIASRLRSIEKPVLASLNGIAAGAGASLAFACDLRIASRSAAFSMAFAAIGLVPDCGATMTLLQHVGYSKALELCWLGEKLTAEEAHRIGLVNKLVEPEALAEETQALAQRLAHLPTRGLGMTKRAFNRAWTASLDDHLEYEAFLQQSAGATRDHYEGVRAFLEKRKPAFEGR